MIQILIIQLVVVLFGLRRVPETSTRAKLSGTHSLSVNLSLSLGNIKALGSRLISSCPVRQFVDIALRTAISSFIPGK